MIYLKIVERLRTQFLKHTYRGIPSVKRKNEEQLPGLQALECVCTVHLAQHSVLLHLLVQKLKATLTS